MKTNLLRTSIVAALAATAAFAQDSALLKATVPFAFIAGKQVLPAGQYTVDQGPAAGVLMIRSADGGRTAIVLAQPASSAAPHAASLVFHRYGSTCFLSEVWSPGNGGSELPPTRRERELIARRAATANTTIAAVQ